MSKPLLLLFSSKGRRRLQMMDWKRRVRLHPTLSGTSAEIGERGKAWRSPTTSTKAKEYTAQFTPGASALDPVVATFADGMKRRIPEFLTAAALEEKQIVASEKEVHVTLEGPIGAPIVVKDGADRNTLPQISLFLSSKQVCQIVP